MIGKLVDLQPPNERDIIYCPDCREGWIDNLEDRTRPSQVCPRCNGVGRLTREGAPDAFVGVQGVGGGVYPPAKKAKPMPRLIDLIPMQPLKCQACNGVGSIMPADDTDDAMLVFLGEKEAPTTWALCSKCEGIGRVFPNGKPARMAGSETGACEPPSLI